MQIRFNRRGISMVETVVALLILATIGSALMVLNVQIQSVANSAKFKSVAESEAQQMLEQVRSKKNAAGGISGLVDGCYSDPTLPSPDLTGCTPTTQAKYVVITAASGGKKVQSVVAWNEKGKNYFIEVDTYLYDY